MLRCGGAGGIMADRSMGSLQVAGAAASVQLNPMAPALRGRQAGSRPSARTAAVEYGADTFTLPVQDQVPILDLAELRCGGHDQSTHPVTAACREWGFFQTLAGIREFDLQTAQVVNHGVSMEFIHRFRKLCLDVFSLPPEQKDKISRRRQGSRWGYDFRPDYGPMEVLQLNPFDARQTLTYGNELFPNSSEEFMAVCEEAKLVFRTLAMEILDILIQSLRVDAKHFEVHRADPQGILRANYYHQSTAPDQVLGLVPHVDGNLFTILHQQDVTGLELLKDGRWIPITPRSDAFCINVADIMKVLTNGRYRSVQHRAVAPKTQTRLSLAYFLKPADGVPLIPAPELIDEMHPPLYRPFTWAEFEEAAKVAGRAYPSVLPFFEHGHTES